MSNLHIQGAEDKVDEIAQKVMTGLLPSQKVVTIQSAVREAIEFGYLSGLEKAKQEAGEEIERNLEETPFVKALVAMAKQEEREKCSGRVFEWAKANGQLVNIKTTKVLDLITNINKEE